MLTLDAEVVELANAMRTAALVDKAHDLCGRVADKLIYQQSLLAILLQANEDKDAKLQQAQRRIRELETN